MNAKIVVVAGPTAVGKTDMAIRIAEEFGGEIVSCDSMQLYKYMDIGSAKPTPEELARVPHHLVDVIDPAVDFSVAEYQALAKQAIADILSRGRLPVVSGGTGLYLNSLLYDMDFSASPGDLTYRRELEKLAEEKGSGALHDMLSGLDAEAAARIHPHNVKKVIRALERLKLGESRVRQFRDITRENDEYEAVLIGLTRDRTELYERINRRVDALVSRGLFAEVERLRDMGLTADMISMKGIGYKEILHYLDGEYTREEAVERIKKNTRHYAKKQLTWFRRYDRMKWYSISDFDSDDKAAEEIMSWVRENV